MMAVEHGEAGPGPILPLRRVEFVVLCHAIDAVSAAGIIDLDDLVKGRVDMLARIMSTAIFVDHGVRRDVRLWLLFVNHGRTVEVDVSRVKNMMPDERSCARNLRDALEAKSAIPSNSAWRLGAREIRTAHACMPGQAH